MQIIKKYANRKLYHTNQKQYITLDGIARLIQNDEAVQVLDNESGDDITPSILAQVVLHAHGRSGGQLPTPLLTGLIQVGGDTLTNLRRTLFMSLGGARAVENELGRRIDHLVATGALGLEESLRWRQLLLHEHFNTDVEQVSTGPDVEMPSRNDMVQLNSQVDALAEIVEQLLRQRKQ